MKTACIVLALASSAAAFAPATQKNNAVTSLNALSDMAGYTAPFKGYDPLGLADLGSDETLAWFRAAELKHSRVAMLATSGYLFQAAGFHFPGMLSKDISFESLSSMKPFDAWDAVPDAGKFLRTLFFWAIQYNYNFLDDLVSIETIGLDSFLFEQCFSHHQNSFLFLFLFCAIIE